MRDSSLKYDVETTYSIETLQSVVHARLIMRLFCRGTVDVTALPQKSENYYWTQSVPPAVAGGCATVRQLRNHLVSSMLRVLCVDTTNLLEGSRTHPLPQVVLTVSNPEF